MTKKLIAVVLATLMVFSGFAMAAAPSTDTESTDTSYTSPVTDGDTITYNETESINHSFTADSKNASVTYYQNDSGERFEMTSWDNDSSRVVLDTTASGTSYYNLTIHRDARDFHGLEAAPGEQVSIEIERANDSTLDDPDTSNITVTFDNDDNITWARYNDSKTEISEPGFGARVLSRAPFVGDNTTDPAKLERDLSVNGDSQEEVNIYTGNTSAQSALQRTYDESVDVGGVTFMGVAKVGDSYVPILASGESAPSWLDTSSQTYLEVKEGGEQATVHNAGNALSSDDTTAEVTVVGSEQANFGQIRAMMSDYGASSTDAIWTAATEGELVPFSDQFEV